MAAVHEKQMKLIEIHADGSLSCDVELNDFSRAVLDQTVSFYERTEFQPPWIGYLGVKDDQVICVGGFKSSPQDGRVEIAYATMPGQEGQGYATSIAQELVALAIRHDPRLIVFAQTLPEENASVTVLKRLGFRYVGIVEHPEDGSVWEWELLPSLPDQAN